MPCKNPAYMHPLSLSSLRHVSGEDGGREVSSPFDDMWVSLSVGGLILFFFAGAH